MKKLPKEDEKVAEQKIEQFEYLRKNEVSYHQGIYTALIVALVLVVLDFFSELLFDSWDFTGSFVFKIAILLILIVSVQKYYGRSLRQTLKPIYVSPDIVGTVEKGPHIVKDEDGRKYAIFSLSDVYQSKRNKKDKENTS